MSKPNPCLPLFLDLATRIARESDRRRTAAVSTVRKCDPGKPRRYRMRHEFELLGPLGAEFRRAWWL